MKAKTSPEILIFFFDPQRGRRAAVSLRECGKWETKIERFMISERLLKFSLNNHLVRSRK
jgi:hypothetical protein